MHRTTRILRTLLIVATIVAGVTLVGTGPAAQAHASTPRYSITDLGVLGTGDLSVATAVNNAGMVVGWSYRNATTIHGFRWSGGTLTDLGVEPGAANSWANAVNDAGQVAGTADRPTSSYGYPVSWSATGIIKDLGGPIANRLGVGNGIDPAGRVVGGQRPANSEGDPIAIRYDRAGKQTLLGNPPESLFAATGINARGQIVGGPGFIWRNGVVKTLPGLAGAPNSSTTATAINVGGLVVGAAGSTATGTVHAVAWRDGAIIDIGTLGAIAFNRANAVNAAGQVVGTADPKCQPCVAPRAWIWQAGRTITALDTLIPANSGWTLQQANGINDRGQIVGAGLHNGHMRGYRLTPVFSAAVNFGPSSSAVPVGYALDSGAVYGCRAGAGTYGWNIDNSGFTRDRNSTSSPDQRYDTLIHLQKPGSASRWELAVPNGRYTVHVVSGDPDHLDSVFRITVEGVTTVSGRPTSAAHWLEGTAVVTVTDGRLTITNGAGASNNKLNYVDVIAS